MLNTNDWTGKLDALAAAAGNHTLLFKSDAVRVLDTLVRPGQAVPLHRHQWPSVNYLLSWSDFIRRGASGAILLGSHDISRQPQPGAAFWGSALPPHTLENVGRSELRVITVELKHPVAAKLLATITRAMVTWR
jgi:hypothetical protein